MEFLQHIILTPNSFLNEGKAQIPETEYLVQPLFLGSLYSMNTFIYLFKKSWFLIILKTVDSET